MGAVWLRGIPFASVLVALLLAVAACESTGPRDGDESPAALTGSAEAGDAHAQFLLALRCEDGTDGPADPAAAAHWYERAAAQGFAPAQNNLGLLLFRGRGTERSREQAE